MQHVAYMSAQCYIFRVGVMVGPTVISYHGPHNPGSAPADANSSETPVRESGTCVLICGCAAAHQPPTIRFIFNSTSAHSGALHHLNGANYKFPPCASCIHYQTKMQRMTLTVHAAPESLKTKLKF